MPLLSQSALLAYCQKTLRKKHSQAVLQKGIMPLTTMILEDVQLSRKLYSDIRWKQHLQPPGEVAQPLANAPVSPGLSARRLLLCQTSWIPQLE
jgi:hypothetical protein